MVLHTNLIAKYYSLFILSFIIGSLSSFTVPLSVENSNPILPIQAFYEFVQMQDPADGEDIWKEDFILTFAAGQSVFVSETKLRQDSAINAAFKAARNGDSLAAHVYRPVNAEVIYLNRNQLATVHLFEKNHYKISEVTKSTAWKISSETKSFLGYVCQKATGTVEGIDYIVWFTRAIPESVGPWKFNGLPGLILAVHDVSGRIKFTCRKIVKNPKNSTSIEIPKNAIAITAKDYYDMETAAQEKFELKDSKLYKSN